jgi:hypothetical protein
MTCSCKSGRSLRRRRRAASRDVPSGFSRCLTSLILSTRSVLSPCLPFDASSIRSHASTSSRHRFLSVRISHSKPRCPSARFIGRSITDSATRLSHPTTREIIPHRQLMGRGEQIGMVRLWIPTSYNGTLSGLVPRQTRSSHRIDNTMRILPCLLLACSMLFVGCGESQTQSDSTDASAAAKEEQDAAIEKEKQDAVINNK